MSKEHEVCKAIEVLQDFINEARSCRSGHELATKHDLHQMEQRIIMTQTELANGLRTIQTQVGKVAKEQSDRFDALTKTIADLNAVITAGGDVTPEVTAALADVQTALQSLDDTIPDAPATPPAPPA